ncbi:MAG: hypothetical protein JWM68_152, partial [Verrucomicrobiales bacterium]|nr:hypothetical protein [Verrucomicrobiales bacterium]
NHIMNSLERRIVHLERSLHRMKLLLGLCGAGLAVVVLLGAGAPVTQTFIRAKTIEIVDDNGKTTGSLTTSSGCGQLSLFHVSESAPLIKLGSELLSQDRFGGVIRVGASGQKTPIELAVTPDANGKITLKNGFDRKTLELLALSDGSRLDILSGEVQPATEVRIESILEAVSGGSGGEKKRRSRVEVRTGQEQVRVRLDTEKDAGSVETFSAEGIATGRMPH